MCRICLLERMSKHQELLPAQKNQEFRRQRLPQAKLSTFLPSQTNFLCIHLHWDGNVSTPIANSRDDESSFVIFYSKLQRVVVAWIWEFVIWHENKVIKEFLIPVKCFRWWSIQPWSFRQTNIRFPATSVRSETIFLLCGQNIFPLVSFVANVNCHKITMINFCLHIEQFRWCFPYSSFRCLKIKTLPQLIPQIVS